MNNEYTPQAIPETEIDLTPKVRVKPQPIVYETDEEAAATALGLQDPEWRKLVEDAHFANRVRDALGLLTKPSLDAELEKASEDDPADLFPDPPAPYVPDFTIIPDALAKFAQEDETAAQFRSRLKLLWQRFGIEDGKNFPGGGEALTGEEKITMREIDIVLNSEEGQKAGLLEWMKADRPQD